MFAAVATGVRIASNYIRDNAYTIGDTETAHHEFDADQIEGVRAVVQMGAGVLTVGRMDADKAEQTALSVDITDNVVESISSVRYTISDTVRVAPDLPLDLVIEMGAGELSIQADDLQVTTLSIEMGTGSGIVDLSGIARDSFNGTIDNGMGSVELYLPSDVAVRVEAHAALGSVDAETLTHLEDDDIYVNSLYSPGRPALTLRVDAAVGSVEVHEGPRDRDSDLLDEE